MVRNPLNNTPTRFNLLAGDICYANPSGDAVAIINPDGPGGTQPGDSNTPAPPPNSGGWDDFDPYVWTSYLSTIEPSSASTPWMFATGNHDVELFSAALGADAVTTGYYGSIGYGGHAQRLDLPQNGPSRCPSVYSFTYSNVAIVSVDANDLSYEIQGLHGYSHGTQAAWLRQRLAEFRADPAIDFIVAFYHHCAFSTCSSHSSDGGVRSTLGPLFAQYQVDLAVQGHNHLYERTNPIRYDAATEQRVVDRAGGLPVAGRRRRGPPGHRRHHLRRGRLRRPAPLRWGGPVEDDRNFIVGVNTSDPGNSTDGPRRPGGRDRTLRQPAELHRSLRDHRLVAGPLPRLRLHRPGRRPCPAGWYHDDDVAGHQPAGGRVRPGGVQPDSWCRRSAGLLLTETSPQPRVWLLGQRSIHEIS